MECQEEQAVIQEEPEEEAPEEYEYEEEEEEFEDDEEEPDPEMAELLAGLPNLAPDAGKIRFAEDIVGDFRGGDRRRRRGGDDLRVLHPH